MLEMIQIVGSLIPFVGAVALLRRQHPNRVVQDLLLANIGCLVMNAAYFVQMNAQGDEASQRLKGGVGMF